MKIRFKKLNKDATIPSYARPGDGGLDLTAVSKVWDNESEKVVMGTGLAVEIPEGYVGLIFPRSSIVKTFLQLANSVGVIDSGYRGELKFFFEAGRRPISNYEVGDRIGQLVIIPYPTIEPEEAAELSETVRGESGYGSTGK